MMKKSLNTLLTITALTLCALAFTSCLQFLEPGYWQQLGEKAFSKETVYSIPVSDLSKKYTWNEISTEEAETLWATQAYRSNLKNAPAEITVYQPKSLKSYYKFKNCEREDFPNYIYSEDIAENIYVYAFASDIYGEGSIELNRYIPSNLPDGSKIYAAQGDSSYTKFVIPSTSSSYSEEIYFLKNGFTVQRTRSCITYAVY